ncbi:hypothetical protein DFJ73DRAFT_825991 [Zopfochytrium polystomum]|nr:hypothetical protein DFJ73DRAFT_825991 [Zopfochytrium polystomum]
MLCDPDGNLANGVGSRPLGHAALKFFAAQLMQCSVVEALGDNGDRGGDAVPAHWVFGYFRFTRVWMQGLVVEFSDDGSLFFLDDSTGIVAVVPAVGQATVPKLGREVAVIGDISWNGEMNSFQVGNARVLDKDRDPDAAAAWMLEVCHVHKNVYYRDEDVLRYYPPSFGDGDMELLDEA